MNRRKFLKRTAWSTVGIGLVSGFYAWQIEPFRLEFVNVKMPIKNLPNDLIGKKLMQISDIHVGTRFNHQYIIDSFNEASKLSPDFVVYTGDYVTTYNQKVHDLLSTVLNHIVKGKLGTIGVLGNHDYGKNWSQTDVAEKISSLLEEKGVLMLRNESTEVNGLHFVGFDDLWGPNFDALKTLNSFDKTKANIALCHNPDACDLDVWGEYNSWILSGHTHGGQVKPPFLPPPMLPVKNKKYTAGKFDLDNGKTLYINRALGHLWQIRFNVRPEITIFELTQA
jgi:uncharacterized protein